MYKYICICEIKCLPPEVKSTTELHARGHFTTLNYMPGAIYGTSFVHCCKPYCDCGIQNSNTSVVPLIEFVH